MTATRLPLSDKLLYWAPRLDRIYDVVDKAIGREFSGDRRAYWISLVVESPEWDLS